MASEQSVSDPMSDGYWLKVQDERVDALEAGIDGALDHLRRVEWSPAAAENDAKHVEEAVAILLAALGAASKWRCPDCACLNADTESTCYRCGAGQPEREHCCS